MLSMHELKSVQYLIDHSDEEELVYLKQRAESEIEAVHTASRYRIMTPKKAQGYDFATECWHNLEQTSA